MSADESFAVLPTNPDTLKKLRAFVRERDPLFADATDYECDKLLSALRPSTREAFLHLIELGVTAEIAEHDPARAASIYEFGELFRANLLPRQ